MILPAMGWHERTALATLRDCFDYAEKETGIRASLLAAIAWRESRFELALRDGCGDWTLRRAARYGPPRYRSPADLKLLVVDEPQIGWAWPKDRAGCTELCPMCMPTDRRGFGRGIMQLDWCSHPEIESNRWRDPQENILLGALAYRDALAWLQYRKEQCHTFAVEHVALAAYNCGVHRAYAQVLDGRDPDCVTTGRDYSRWVRAAEVTILHEWEA